MRKLLYTLVSLLLVGQCAMAQVYKSTDSQGNVYYSDKPVGTNAQQIAITPEPQNNDNPASQRTQNLIQKQQQDKEQQQQLKEADQQQAQEKARQDEVQKLCKTSRDNLNILQQSGRRVYEIKPDGEYHYFSEEEKQQQIERLQNQIKKYCQ